MVKCEEALNLSEITKPIDEILAANPPSEIGVFCRMVYEYRANPDLDCVTCSAAISDGDTILRVRYNIWRGEKMEAMANAWVDFVIDEIKRKAAADTEVILDGSDGNGHDLMVGDFVSFKRRFKLSSLNRIWNFLRYEWDGEMKATILRYKEVDGKYARIED